MTAERVFTITRPTGFQVQVRAQSPEQLEDALGAHGWPRAELWASSRTLWALSPLTVADSNGIWVGEHGPA